ncbi:hypothetical protein GCM10009755_20790 [Brevibacterium samyangense]|uniref:Citrate:sodium symporter n=1 Tax=Brevibacterium samyangense TaxID=366888 RepID=A0ABN2THI9_9MICO
MCRGPTFLVLLLIVLAAAYFELLPTNIVSGMALAMLLGFGLKALGDAIPVFNTFGGGALMCILGPALIVFSGLMPESFATLADDFYNELGFSEFVVTGLIVGSLLGMDRRLLVNV